MKVTVKITVELADPGEWTLAFGEETAAEIRKSVKEYVGYGVQTMGVFGNGEVDAKIEWS